MQRGFEICPICGYEPTNGGNHCQQCGTECKHAEHRIFVTSQTPIEVDTPKLPRWRKLLQPHRYFALAKYLMHPIGGLLSPIRTITRKRTDKYYARSLHDIELAREFYNFYFCDLTIPDQAKVLDHGCGRGRNTALLTRLGFHVSSIDVYLDPWWSNLREADFTVVPIDKKYLPYKKDSFDLVLDWGVLGHLDSHALKHHAHEVYRVLRPGGYWATLEAHAEGFGVEVNRRHYGRLHSIDTMHNVAFEAGFKLIRQTNIGFYAPIFPIFVNALRINLNPFAKIYDPAMGGFCSRLVPESRRPLHFAIRRKTNT